MDTHSIDTSAIEGSLTHPPIHLQPPFLQAQRVYVGNLSWNVDREQLRQHMAEAGEVTYAEVLTEPSGRSKVCMIGWLGYGGLFE